MAKDEDNSGYRPAKSSSDGRRSDPGDPNHGDKKSPAEKK